MMIKSTDLESLLKGDLVYWKQVRDELAKHGCSSDQVRKMAQLVVASRYALLQIAGESGLAMDLLNDNPGAADERFPLFNAELVDVDGLKKYLRRRRHRKLVEIIYRDVVGQQPLWQTLKQLSQLAEELITSAVEACYHDLCLKHGTPYDDNGEPMQLNVIAMGKLGGSELNFSSDIDLVCCYANDGQLSGFGNLSYQEFFIRLVKAVVQMLAEHTQDGFVYRVDLRLRPWGDSGPLVLGHSALEHYYQLHGRRWEQYALVKARVLTGSESDRNVVNEIIRSFVYRRYHDHRIVSGLASLKKQIESQAGKKSHRDNIKLGPGGIREIEFFVQALQILRGGRNHRLQTTQIKLGLQELASENLLSKETSEALISAYAFMRLLENHLQMFEDHQVHELPDDEINQRRIAVSMGFDDWASLLYRLDQFRDLVRKQFDDLFHQQSNQPAKFVLDAAADSSDFKAESLRHIRDLGITEAEQVSAALLKFLNSRAWAAMTATGKQRFQELLEFLLLAIADQLQQALVFSRMLDLFSSIAGRSAYIELLAQNQPMLNRLVQLFHDSAWIAEQVSHYPILLETLLQPGTDGRYNPGQLTSQLDRLLSRVKGDRELELDCLRVFKRERTLLIACDELSGVIDTREASSYLSDLAEVIIKAVLTMAMADMHRDYKAINHPPQERDGLSQLAIVAYGKLGGRELHYQSDLDLVFLYDTGLQQPFDSGEQFLQQSEYFLRLAQKMVAISNVMTTSGRLYQIDSRLRPQGSAGLLVSSIDAFGDYQRNKAWCWEHQALTRARVIVGSDQLTRQFKAIREDVLSQPRDRITLMQEIVTMRQRIRQQIPINQDGNFNLKQSPGGLVDIEFMVQFWVLSQANSIGSLCSYSDNISLLNELFRLGLITNSQFKLAAIYQHYHGLLHKRMLQNLPLDVEVNLVEDEAAHVVQCWKACFTDVEK